MTVHSIVIGKIVAPHGVRGDVRVIPLTDFPERFSSLQKVLIDDTKTLHIDQAKFHKQFVLIKFREHNDRNAVEYLRGKLIQIPREEAVKLPEGHFFIFDIIGLQAFTEDGVYLGSITDVLQTGSNDVYIAEQEGKKPVLIPALKTVVKNINLEEKKMIVSLLAEWE